MQLPHCVYGYLYFICTCHILCVHVFGGASLIRSRVCSVPRGLTALRDYLRMKPICLAHSSPPQTAPFSLCIKLRHFPPSTLVPCQVPSDVASQP